MRIDNIPPGEPLHMLWHKLPVSRKECRLACALSIYIKFEDGTPLDDTTIGEIVGYSSGVDSINCNGLVSHLQQTNEVYPEVLAGGHAMAVWARNAWNKWMDPEAALVGTWP